MAASTVYMRVGKKAELKVEKRVEKRVELMAGKTVALLAVATAE